MNDLLFAVRSSFRRQVDTQDVEAGLDIDQKAEQKELANFFVKVEEVKADLADIKAQQQKLVQLHEQSKATTRPADTQRVRDEMQAVVDAANTTAHRVRQRFDELDQLNQQALQRANAGVGSTSERTRTSVTTGLKRKLKDQMGDFTALRQKIHADYRDVIARRVFTVTGQNLNEAEVEKIITSGESEAIFQKAILDQGRGHVLDTWAEIQERHKAAKNLEASLLELHQIFLDMAVLVETQGDMLDNIERQVGRALGHVQVGTNHVEVAKQLQKSSRNWMCCGILFLLIVAVIIAIIVVVVVHPW